MSASEIRLQASRMFALAEILKMSAQHGLASWCQEAAETLVSAAQLQQFLDETAELNKQDFHQ